MKRSVPRSLRNHLPQALLFVALLALYIRTLAPGLSWANGGYDGGDLITAAATGGVAHPTGYPLYLLLGRLFQLLPLGSLALRTNLMSALLTALAAALVYPVVTASLAPAGPARHWSVGIVAGLAFGVAPLVWSQAVITEVYALQAFLVVSILYLYLRPLPVSNPARGRLSGWRGLALGLAMGNHLTALLLLPAALTLGSVRTGSGTDGASPSARAWIRTLKFDPPALWGQLAGLFAGLCSYLLLPIRALAHAPVNWGNPVTPGRLWWLVSGGSYQSYYLGFDLAGAWGRVQAWAGLMFAQFGLPGIALGLLGLVVYATRSRLYAFTAWMAVSSLGFAILYRSDDSYVYLAPMVLSFAIWAGLGLAGLQEGLSKRLPILGGGLGLLVIAYFLARALLQVNAVDASGDRRAEAFGREVLSAAPENALVFAEGDRAVFALWYFHFALDERPDLAVMAADLLHFDWYQETLKYTYPSLAVPGPFPWPTTVALANPDRPACTVRFSDRTEIECARPLAIP